MSIQPAADNWCTLIPAYNEAGRIGTTVRGVLGRCPCVVVVDDGSTDGTVAEAEAAGATVVRHEQNRGKGVALNTGLAHAKAQGFAFVITLDADGQHAPEDIPGFLDVRARRNAKVIVGNRMADPRDMPWLRRWTNRFMSWLLSRKMGQRVPDTQNGYRLYDASVFDHLMAEAAGFAAESEVLLNLADAGFQIESAPVQIIYRDETSKINPVRDTIRFFGMLRRHGRQTDCGHTSE